MHATYSAEDNKLRLYVGRVPRDDYERLRKAGFTSTPKQECDFVATWTPEREDLAREFLDDGDDIGDEDYSPQERAHDRAERFGEYRDKRAAEAGASADAFDAGPSAFGHQSRARAERQAARHDRKRTYAVSQWSKAEYWQERTRGVIAHALYKSSAHVRRGRILTLEAEQRKHEKDRAEYAARFAGWSKVATLEGAERPGCYVRTSTSCGFDPQSVTPALKLAYNLANHSGYSLARYTHPRTGKADSLYDHLTDETDPITPAEAAALWLADARDPADPESIGARWSDHYNNRLTYERAMLAEEGGTAGDAEMIPGGWIANRDRYGGSCMDHAPVGWVQIQSVNKSPATGRVVSVKVWGTTEGYTKESNYKEYGVKPALVTVNVERLPEGAYRAPTPEELEAFKKATAERKAEEKAKKPAASPLVNPTDADAEKLQAIWNAKALERFNEWKKGHGGYGELEPVAVRRMTQAEYSARSKGSYGNAETVDVCENGQPPNRWHENKRATNPPVACKIRKTYGGGGFTAQAYAVIVITDKPQKPLPLDWDDIAAGTAGSDSSAKAEPVAVAS